MNMIEAGNIIDVWQVGNNEKNDNVTIRLQKTIMKHSTKRVFPDCLIEWKSDGYKCDDIGKSICTCGKKNIKYLSIIKNDKTNKKLIIGSSCIQKLSKIYDNELLDKLLKGIKKLKKYIKQKKDITTLTYNFKYDCFYENKYNKNVKQFKITGTSSLKKCDKINNICEYYNMKSPFWTSKNGSTYLNCWCNDIESMDDTYLFVFFQIKNNKYLNATQKKTTTTYITNQ